VTRSELKASVGQVVFLKSSQMEPCQLALLQEVSRNNAVVSILSPRPTEKDDDGMRDIPLSDIVCVIDMELMEAVRNLLRYSWADINFQHSGLTNGEKKAIGSKGVHGVLVNLVRSK
jgi:hypothetical protein